jgi:HEAT repeat protein
VNGLRDVDPSVRRDCAGACGRLGPAAGAAAARLTALLTEPEGRTRAVIAVALKRLGAAGVPALRKGAESADPELRGRCAALLAELAPGDPLAAARSNDPAESAARADDALRHVQTPPPVAIPRLRSGVGVGDIDALADAVLLD